MKKLYFISLLASLLLTACGGGDSTSPSIAQNNGAGSDTPTDRPVFARSLVTESPSYSPSGNITDPTPTFSWKAIAGASSYFFGHENTDDASDWHEYQTTPDNAGCPNEGDICEVTPTDYTFDKGVEKAWWVRAKINDAWQDWSRPVVFTVVDDNSNNVGIPVPETPAHVIHSAHPQFSWVGVSGASNYKIGYEGRHGREGQQAWHEYFVSAQDANCSTTQSCQISLPQASFSNVTYGTGFTWWIKAKVGNQWGEWSEGKDFSILYKPFANTPDVTDIVSVGNKSFGIRGKSVLLDDGNDNITTLFTSYYGIQRNRVSNLMTNIAGKVIFVSLEDNSGNKKSEVYSIDVNTLEVNKSLSIDGEFQSLIFKLKDFSVLMTTVPPQIHFPYIKYYKIDKNGEGIFLGVNDTDKVFDIQSIDTTIVRVKAGSRDNLKIWKVTSAAGTGLELIGDYIPYKPFANMPDVTDIVKTGAHKWFGIRGKSVLLDDGNDNITTLFTSYYGIQSSLMTNITPKIIFVSHEDSSGNQISEIHTIDINTLEVKKSLSINGEFRPIVFKMYNYSIFRTVVPPQIHFPYIKFYKIDENGEGIFLGVNDTDNVFSIEPNGIDQHANIIHVEAGNRDNPKKWKVTRTAGVGLEEE